MAGRHHRLAEADRLSRWMRLEIGRELKAARLNAGMSQRLVGRAMGRSASRVSRTERGLVPSISLTELNRHAAVVGLRLKIQLWPGGRRLLDTPQLSVLRRFNDRIAASWRRSTEVPVPIPGDLRAVDERLIGSEGTVLVEAITRLVDFQAQSRAPLAKQRDFRSPCLVLLVAGTPANRRALRDAGSLVRESFPVGTREALRALGAGRLPAGNAIVLI